METRSIKKLPGQLCHLDSFQHFVVHCKKSPFDVYIGRDCIGKPQGVEARWGNPFVMKNQRDNDERYLVTVQYEKWLRSQPELMAAVRSELRGKVLGCFCSPLMCHGRVLASIANEDVKPSAQERSCEDLRAARPHMPAISSVEGDSKPSGQVEPTKQQLRNRLRREKKRLAKEVDIKTGLSSIVADESNGHTSSMAAASVLTPVRSEGFVDIGINITSKELKAEWRAIISRAIDANVSSIMLTGTTLLGSQQSAQIARQWDNECGCRVLHCTAGVHPHYAKTFTDSTYAALKELLQDPFVVAVGECGLDFNRNHSSREDQLLAFRQQVWLACETRYPLFVHEREAHRDLLSILDEFSALPAVVIHCFTGTTEEAAEYIRRGFYIGFTGTICKKERGAPLRALISTIPLDRLMIETDAPYMGFVKSRRNSEPADVVQVAAQIAQCLCVDVETVRRATTENAKRFFNINHC